MSEVINVPKMLEPTASDGKLAAASAIFDKDLQKFQSELNAVTIRGVTKVVQLEGNIIAEESPDENTQTDVIYVNDTGEQHTVGVSHESYRTPDGRLMVVTVPAGGYAEINFLNIGGTVFVRGL